MHMNIYVFFENMNVLCIFAQPVFWSSLLLGFCPVPIRFWFSGSAGLTSGSALITLGATGRGKPVKAMDCSLASGLGLSHLLEPKRFSRAPTIVGWLLSFVKKKVIEKRSMVKG